MPGRSKVRSAVAIGLVALALGGCASGSAPPRCAPDGGAACADGTACLWLRGGGYFCVSTCASGFCPVGRTCQTGGASSCATCDDLLDICE